jgi:hypothetical protein
VTNSEKYQIIRCPKLRQASVGESGRSVGSVSGSFDLESSPHDSSTLKLKENLFHIF